MWIAVFLINFMIVCYTDVLNIMCATSWNHRNCYLQQTASLLNYDGGEMLW